MSRIVDIRTSRMRNFIAFQRDPLGLLVEVLQDGDVISLRSGEKRPSYIVNAPEFIHEILVAREAYFRKGRSSEVLRRTIGDGLLTSEKEEHRRQKKYLMPAFYKERIQAYARIVAEESRRAIESLQDGQPVELHDEMMRLTLSVIAKGMFATDVAERKKELADAVDIAIRESARTLFFPFIVPFGVPTRGHRVHKRAIRTLESVVREAITDARKRPDRYEESLLGLLLDTKDEDGKPITDTEVRDQLMTMLIAGHETTANALVWAWYSLDREPDAAAKFHAEVDAPGQSEGPAFEQYRKLKYTQQIIQETLRLYPPAWTILREAEREVDVLGETFPAGSSFLISPYAVHRNPRVFGDPYAFRPERFAEESAGWPRFAYFPFGGGSRGCIGSQFAMMEAALILAELGRAYRFERTTEAAAIPEPLISLRVKGGLRMRPCRRT
ncbi:cytochrome P450 [Paenibacillus sp. tmac-D7]|uniref:cytochrome P450 n=1 Tax=Paenibacillus sp. tmac-D7 TaxID=2591462 RepID=UPI0011414D02|nr:cytochrome P450 [Paenibacillus sp. tmac-D7]